MVFTFSLHHGDRNGLPWKPKLPDENNVSKFRSETLNQKSFESVGNCFYMEHYLETFKGSLNLVGKPDGVIG